LSFHPGFPVSFQFGEVTIYLHALLEFLAFVIAFRYYVILRRKTNDLIPAMNRIWILIGATAGALVFSRLIASLESPSRFFSGDEPITYYIGNKTIIGGLLGGLVGVEVVKKWIGEKTSSGDLFTYPLILGIIIGRLGCFSMGVHEETYGNPTEGIFGIDLGDGIPRHATVLYEVIFLILLWITLVRLENIYELENGTRFKFFMVSLLVFRCAIEFLRPGERWMGLTTIQWCCILGLAYYWRVWLQPKKLFTYAKSQ
jgi:phosphatidylglycerol---prolipoprotein diacylglyceryl transferase